MATEFVSTASEIVPASEFIVVLSSAKKLIEELREKHRDVPAEIKNALDQAKVEAAWRDFRIPRIEFEKKVVATIKDLRAQVKGWDDEGKSIISALEIEEDKFKAIIDTEKERKDAIKREKEEAEAARIKNIKDRISKLRQIPVNAVSEGIDWINGCLEYLREITLDEVEFDDHHIEAVEVLNAAIESLEKLLSAKIETARIAEEQHQMALALEAARKADAEKLAAERAAFEAEQKKAKEQQAEKEREERMKAAIEKEEERKRLATEQKAINDANEAARKELADKQAELDNQAQLIADQQAEANRAEHEKQEAEERKAREAKAEFDRIAAEEKEKRDQQEYKDRIEAMPVLVAFESIRSANRDNSYVCDICESQIAKIKVGTAIFDVVIAKVKNTKKVEK